jgi:hypothetical protein
MIDIENEVNKHKNIKDRDELVRLINDYKNLAIQNATNLAMAGQYSAVAHKLQEICDRLPAPKLVKYPTGAQGAPSKTANITSEEQKRIDADWRKRTKK